MNTNKLPYNFKFISILIGLIAMILMVAAPGNVPTLRTRLTSNGELSLDLDLKAFSNSLCVTSLQFAKDKSFKNDLKNFTIGPANFSRGSIDLKLTGTPFDADNKQIAALYSRLSVDCSETEYDLQTSVGDLSYSTVQTLELKKLSVRNKTTLDQFLTALTGKSLTYALKRDRSSFKTSITTYSGSAKAPVINTDLENKTFQKRQDLYFRFNAEGAKPVRFDWFYKRFTDLKPVQIKNSQLGYEVVSDAKGSSMLIRAALINTITFNGSEIYVVASNKYGKASSKVIEVKVVDSDLPTITPTPVQQCTPVACENGNYRCTNQNTQCADSCDLICDKPTVTQTARPSSTATTVATNTTEPTRAPTNTHTAVPTSTTQPTVTQRPACAAPVCSDGALRCGSPDGCPQGCGTICIKNTSTPTVTPSKTSTTSPSITMTRTATATKTATSTTSSSTDGLIAHYDFEEGSGVTAADKKGNFSALSTQNSSFTAGKVGKYSLSHGASSLLSVPGLFSQPEALTLSVWAEFDSSIRLGTPPWKTTLLDLGGVITLDLQKALDNNNVAKIELVSAYKVSTYSSYTTCFDSRLASAYNGNSWHHFVLVADPRNGVHQVYVDNVLICDSAHYTNPISYSSAVVSASRVGGEAIQDQDYSLRGKIDDFRVYNKALSRAKVDELFKLSSSVTPTPTASPTITQMPVCTAIACSNGVLLCGSPDGCPQGCGKICIKNTLTPTVAPSKTSTASPSIAITSTATRTPSATFTSVPTATVTATATATVSAPTAVGNLVAHYSFEEGSGTTVADSTGNSPAFTLNGSSFITGVVGNKAITREYNLPSWHLPTANAPTANTLFSKSQATTVSIWAYLDGITYGSILDIGGVIKLEYSKASLSGSNQYFYSLYGRKHVGSGVSYGLGTEKQFDFLGTGWKHIVLVFDSIAGDNRLYVNGQLIDSNTDKTPIVYQLANNTFIRSDTKLGKTVDEFKVYNKALSPAEVSGLFNTKVNASCGQAAGAFTKVEPTNNLCDSGLASRAVLVANHFDWTCSGTNGGSNASCSSVMPGNLLAHYKFEEGSSVTATVDSQNHYPAGTIRAYNSFTSSAAAGNYAYVNSASGVTIPTLFDNQQSISLSTWINLSSNSPDKSTIADLGGVLKLEYTKVLYSSDMYTLNAFWNVGNNQTSSVTISVPGDLRGTGWHHVSLVLNPVNGTTLLYLDGIKPSSYANVNFSRQSIVYSEAGNTSLRTNTILGKDPLNYSSGLIGQLDDFRVYAGELSANQISYIYKYESNPSCGSAFKANLVTAPVTDLCKTGDSSAVVLEGNAFKWDCSSVALAKSVSCFANKMSEDGLIAHYDFEEGSGGFAADKTGRFVRATILGSTFVPGKKDNYALQHISGNSIVTPGTFSNSQMLTLSIWANLDSDAPWGNSLFDLGDSINLTYSLISGPSASYNTLRAQWQTGTNEYQVMEATIPTDYRGTGWHLFTLVLDTVKGDQRLYADNVLLRSYNSTTPIYYTNTGNTRLGGSTKYSYYNLHGKLDDFRVYGRALTAQEVAGLYN